jgi:hypothetical protein
MSIGDIGKAFRFLDVVIDFFQSIPRRVTNLGNGFNDIFNGIGSEFVALGMGVELGFGDIVTLIQYTFEFLITYITCGVYFLSNIRNCFFYYLLEIVGQILYLPFRILLWVLNLFGINLYGIVDNIWIAFDDLDTYVYTLAGFHIIHYPKSIREQCYVCKRLKVKVLTNKAHDISDDFKYKIPEIMTRGIATINQGKRELDSVIE